MEAIKYYVKGAFIGVAETPEVLEQQEELIADLSAKVADLVADGRSEDEALGMAIASMGDLSGLVREFDTDASAIPVPAAPVVRTVEVYSNRLRLHVVAISSGLAIAALFVLSLVAGVGGAFNGAAALWDLFLGGLGVAWTAYTVKQFHEDPAAVGEITLDAGARFRRAALQWVGVCAGAFVLNLAFQSDGFWAWTIWIAAFAWPLSFYVEDRMLAAGRFLHPTQTPQVSGALVGTAADCA